MSEDVQVFISNQAKKIIQNVVPHTHKYLEDLLYSRLQLRVHYSIYEID